MNQTKPSMLLRTAIVLLCLVFAAPAVAQEDGASETAGAEQASDNDFSRASEREKLWDVEKAATFYERFAEAVAADRAQLTGDRAAMLEEALRKAAKFRELLGDSEQAIENHEAYLKHFGGDKPARAEEALFAIARLYQEMGEDKKALAQYERILEYFEDTSQYDALLEARAAIATHHHQKDDPASRKGALTEFREVLDLYASLDPSDQSRLSRGRDAAARAKFRLAEELYDEMARITVEDASEAELKKLIVEKMKVAERAQIAFQEVIKLRRPEWAIAALYKMGLQFQDFANTVRTSPPPDDLVTEQQATYRKLLEDRAQTIELKAIDHYTKALDVAHEQNWFNSYAKKAAERLTALDPEGFPDMSETFE